MKTLLTFILLLFFNIFAHAQITSENVLEYIERNQAAATTSSGISQTVLVQIGNYNLIEVVDKTPEYLGVSQIGDSNTTLYFNQNKYPTNAEIHIQGRGNYVEVLGSNSISDGMKININANDMTMYMRNY